MAFSDSQLQETKPEIIIFCRIVAFAEKKKAGLFALPFSASAKAVQGFLGSAARFFSGLYLSAGCLHAMPLSGPTCSAAERTVLQQCLYQDLHARTHWPGKEKQSCYFFTR